MQACQMPFVSFLSEDEEFANQVQKKAAMNIKKETGLIPFGSGGQMMDQIKMLHLAFICHQPINIEKGRELALKASEELLLQINSEEKIRPFLNNFPFEPQNIIIELYIQKADGHSFGGEILSVVFVNEGIIKYKIDDPNSNQLLTIFEEKYEEALQKLNDANSNTGIIQKDDSSIRQAS
jgi:hypothetical protein